MFTLSGGATYSRY